MEKNLGNIVWVIAGVLSVVAMLSILQMLGSLGSDLRENAEAAKAVPELTEVGELVLPDVYDNGRSTVFIKSSNHARGSDDKVVADLMVKKRKWEEDFPTKKTVAMSVVPTDTGLGRGRTVVAGLLIHYEQR